MAAAGIEARQHPPAQIKAREKLGTAEKYVVIDGDYRGLRDHHLTELEREIEAIIMSHGTWPRHHQNPAHCALRPRSGKLPVQS